MGFGTGGIVMDRIPIIEDLEEWKFLGYRHTPYEQVLYKFENDFGASVILGPGSYGLEMMISTPDWNYDKDYVKAQLMRLDSDLYYDVVGHMDRNRMEQLLKGIQNLKPFIEVGK